MSLVAVCCSSDSVISRLRVCNSLKRRTFSMAITAWLANVSINAICLAFNGLGSMRRMVMTPMAFGIFGYLTRLLVEGLKCACLQNRPTRYRVPIERDAFTNRKHRDIPIMRGYSQQPVILNI